MGFDKPFADSQAEPDSAGASRTTCTVEPVENPFQLSLGDPFAAVHHHNPELIAMRQSLDHDRRSMWRIFDRVVHEINDHLRDQHKVHGD